MSLSRHQHITDQELLHHFYRDGNNEWLGILLQRYTLLLFGLCMKYLKDEAAAKDMVQQVHLKVLSELPRYKVTFFKSWLYTIAKNQCLMELRNKGIVVRDMEDKLSQEVVHEESIEILFEKEKKLEEMEAAIAQLNPEQNLCIRLFYFSKKSYQQISSETDFSVSQVKSHIQNGKRNLRIMLERNLNNEK